MTNVVRHIQTFIIRHKKSGRERVRVRNGSTRSITVLFDGGGNVPGFRPRWLATPPFKPSVLLATNDFRPINSTLRLHVCVCILLRAWMCALLKKHFCSGVSGT